MIDQVLVWLYTGSYDDMAVVSCDDNPDDSYDDHVLSLNKLYDAVCDLSAE